MITTFYPPYHFGGDGISVGRLSNELGRLGHKVDVIHCTDSYRLLSGKNKTRPCEDHPNVTVHRLKSQAGFFSPLVTHQIGYPAFQGPCIREILGQGFDVIHYHNISLIGGPKVLTFGEGIKLYTMREYWFICPTHTLFKFNRRPCVKKHCLPCSIVQKRPVQWWRYTRLLKNSIKHVDRFIAPSAFCRDLHHRMGFNAPIDIIPNFVPSAVPEKETHERRANERPKKPYFLFVGRLEKIKGLQDLIPVFRSHPSLSLWIAGTGAYEKRLRNMAGESDNIRFFGFLDETALQGLYENAVALIVPSLCYENFGNVILEGFKQKTPAIVRNRGGMPELVEESGGGYVYDNEVDLLAVMARLMKDPSYRNELGRRGYDAYRKKWTAEAHLEKYFRLIGDLANKDHAGSALP